MENSPRPFRLKGAVKWFDPQRGYGMILPEAGEGPQESAGPGDIFIHITCVRRAGHDPEIMQPGAIVTCEVSRGPKGLQALEILNIEGGGTLAPPRDISTERAFFAGVRQREALQEAEVKWFNAQRGYGFLTRKEGGPDIFISSRVLRQTDMADLYPGQRVMVRIEEGKSGLMAAEVVAQPVIYRRRGMLDEKKTGGGS